MLVSLLQFYILFIAWMLAQCEGCDTGWFGDKCEFMCHCLSSQTCDIDGKCPNNGPCKQGFFGPACQYVNVVQLTTTAGPDQFLRDGSDTTCNPQPDDKIVAVSLTEAVPITWFRLALKDKRNMLNFVTTLNDANACTNERKYPVSDTLVDVTCDGGTMINSLKISGPAAGSLCSVYISGGRNVAIKQATNQSSDFNPSYRFKSKSANAVDGDTDQEFDNLHCSHTDNDPLPAWWSLRFSMPQIIHKVVIYNRGGGYEVRLRKFYIETFYQNNTKIAVYNESYDTARLKYEINISTPNPVASFILTKIQTNPSEIMFIKALGLCEVQAFGDTDCPLETYGFYCENKCQCNTTDTCHPVSGVCGHRGCQQGFYGPSCSSHCNSNCLHGVCELYSGICFYCVPGYFGARCEQACDPGSFGPGCGLTCTDRCATVCNKKDGQCRCKDKFKGVLCTECSATRYGADCDYNCPDFCENKLCDNLTGECLICVGNRIGPFCEDCPLRYFGPLCESRCSEGCVNRSCDQVSGKCPSCEKGYEGWQCLKIQEWNPIWLLCIPIVIALCLLFLCRRRTHATHGEG